jgi:transcriptional regulator with XRE-family HTH domain
MKKRVYNNLYYHRRIWGYTLKDVAFLLGIASTSIISRWEKGIEAPSHANFLILAYIYRTPCERLYWEYRQELIAPIHERELVLQAMRDESTCNRP